MKRRCLALAAAWLLAGGVAFAGRGVSVTLGTWTDRQPFVGSNGAAIHFYLFSPKAAAAGKKLPLVLWLHGGLKSNGRGGPNLPMAAFYRDEDQARQPCFVLRPVAVQGKNWVSPRGAGTASHKQPAEPAPSVGALMELLEKTVKAHPIDPNGLHVTGASMGGYGTWDVIARYPGRFATAIPICGGGDPSRAAAIKDMKVWVFHSADDRIVPPRGSREMFAALLAARGEKPLVKDDDKQTLSSSADGHVRYTEFKSGGHNAWDRALGDPKVIEWVFAKGKANGNSAR